LSTSSSIFVALAGLNVHKHPLKKINTFHYLFSMCYWKK
jgi:hypothetical protein